MREDSSLVLCSPVGKVARGNEYWSHLGALPHPHHHSQTCPFKEHRGQTIPTS